MYRKLIVHSLVAISLVGGVFVGATGRSFAAGTASFSLSPASGSQAINSTFSVGIYENGTGVNVVTANFSYDTAKLQLVGVDAAGSAFASDAGTSGTSISRYVPAGGTVSGSVKVASVTFKAIAGSGSAAVTVGTAGSHIAASGAEQWNGVATTGSYALTTPVVAPVPTPSAPTTPVATTTTQTPTTSSNTTSGTSTASTATPTTTAPTPTSTTPSTKSSNKSNRDNNRGRNNHSWRHTAAVTSSSLALLVALAGGVYWTLLRRREPVVAPVVYKLNQAPKKSPATARAKTTTAAKSKAQATKTKAKTAVRTTAKKK